MSFAIIAVSVAVGSLTVSAVNAAKANKQAQEEADRAKTAEGRLELRQEQMDERGVPDIGRHFRSIDGMINNQMKDLQVSTAAAEFEAEQQNVALANMQSSMQQFGFGAGGATALLQGQLSGRRGIAADIARQEAQNRQLEAQGEQQVMFARAGEARRMQSMAAESEVWGFNVLEGRDQAYMDRQAGLSTGHRTNELNLKQQSREIWGSAIPNAVIAGGTAYAGKALG